MDNDIVIRALTIGASVFITLLTVTAVMMYYNTARMSVLETGTGVNIEKEYREDIKTILYNSEITGADLKNILQYFYKDAGINIYIEQYAAFDKNGSKIVKLPIDQREYVNLNETSIYTDIMKDMLPNQKFEITKNKDQEKYTFKLKQ